MGLMRHYMLPALALLSACGEAIPDDQFANDGYAAPAEAVTEIAATPVRIGELGPNFDACGAVGTTRRVAAGEVLPVLAAPFSAAAQTASLPSGGRFFICSRSLDQKWLGVVFDEASGTASGCGVDRPISSRRAYAGGCRSGWVSSALVKTIAGSGVPPVPPVPPVPAAPAADSSSAGGSPEPGVAQVPAR